MALAGLGFLLITGNSLVGMLGLALYGVGILSFYGPFGALPPALLSPRGLAVSIAVINSCSSLGGFLANKLAGQLAMASGESGIFMLEAVMCFLAVVVMVAMRNSKVRAYGAAASSDTQTNSSF